VEGFTEVVGDQALGLVSGLRELLQLTVPMDMAAIPTDTAFITVRPMPIAVTTEKVAVIWCVTVSGHPLVGAFVPFKCADRIPL
jgi:hypothetical protein